MAEWGVSQEVRDCVVLVTCELVTNALEHARPAVNLHLAHDPGRRQIQVAVTDGGPNPRPGAWTRTLADDEHGRGLVVVRSLAIAHGVRTHHGSTTRWAELSSVSTPGGAAEEPARSAAP
ncbi:ATP-binding protein [Streptomyces sp. NPDC001177]